MPITILIKAPNSSITDTIVPTIAGREDPPKETAEKETKSSQTSQILDYNIMHPLGQKVCLPCMNFLCILMYTVVDFFVNLCILGSFTDSIQLVNYAIWPCDPN